MFAFKTAVYALTIAGGMFSAFWQLKLRREWIDEVLEKDEGPSDYGILYSLSTKIMRHLRLQESLPAKVRFKLRVLGGLNFLFVVVLCLEVVLLQR
ncbi:MAG: hypothetical protein P4K93_14720 [Terracidiphilus sp.]|nr:hypothetical protein [Terracidiphilus sp.]MDR3799409.1 hypothetical protein [Terracidiphilus sp.]